MKANKGNTNNLRIKLFCDESGVDGKWLYLGILVVPEYAEIDLLQDLLNKRCAITKTWGKCTPQCKYHQKNDTEVHFSETHKSKDTYFVADRWIDYLLQDRKNIYFYILGIDLTKLDTTKFGSDNQKNNIYNRFFRTAVLRSVKSYFNSYDQILIENICHDNNTGLETHAYFPWHAIFSIDQKDTKISFNNKEIDFIDSDHKKSLDNRSHFIQLIDLILGATRNCIDYSLKDDRGKLSEKISDLIQRLIKSPNNIKSSYAYVGRQKIEFFPKNDLRGLDERSIEYQYRRLDSFYTTYQSLKIRDKNQAKIFDY